MRDDEIRDTKDTAGPAERLFIGLLGAIEKARHPVDTLTEVLPDLAYMRVMIVNLCFVGHAGAPSGSWTLVDAGLPGAAGTIIDAAHHRFGTGSRPSAIVLTHGHFDHVGAIKDLVEEWNVPVYAHEGELPFLTGKMDYMEPDPGVDPGLMAKVSPLYPEKAIDLGDRVQPLPRDGRVPGMPGWRWVHTPGHTPGHVALFRESDRALIAGDAFTTTKQESAMSVMTQKKTIQGPPKYLTPDWQKAWESVRRLEALKPNVAVTGHGLPLRGDELATHLAVLAADFDRIAIPG